MAKVLLVEDVPMIRRTEVFKLKTFQCDVDEADCGEQALGLAASNHYDFMLLDLGLPDMNGIDVAKKIRETEQTSKKHLVIIALTANTDEKYRKLALEVGMDDYVSKPLRDEMIKDFLQKYSS